MSSRNRAAEILYDSEAALRLIASQLGELGRPSGRPDAHAPEDDGDTLDGASDTVLVTQSKRS